MTKSLRILCLSLVAIISSVSFGIEYTSAVKVPTGNDIDLVAVLGTESVSQYEELAKAIAAAKEVAAGEWTDFMAYQLEALNKLIEEAEQMYEEASANDDEVAEKIGVHKAARNVLAVNEADESAGTMYDAYITLSDVFEKGAGIFANSLLNAYNELAECYSEGKNMTSALTEFNSLVTLTSSIDLFTPVTDAASLAAGKRYVVAAADSAVAMSAQYEGATPYRQSASISKISECVESKVAVTAEDELPYMVELVAAEKGWLLKDVVNGKFLFCEEKRSLGLTGDMSKASAFEIFINEEGEAVIEIVGKDCILRYCAEDDRFACYTTGQEAIKLYEDADANDFFLAYPELANVFNTNQSMWMIPAVSEKAMTVVEAANAINAAGVVACAPEDLKNAVAAIEEFIAYANAMDPKYSEFKEALYACYDLQDNSIASVKVATAFAAVVDKYSAYLWSVPATTVAEFDTYIAELNEAARNYALKAAPAGDFTFDNIAVESEWNGAELGKSLTGHLYNPAAKAFLGTANSWGTQASFLENGFKWTVSSEAICDFEWLFDGAEDICEANVGDINLVPLKVVGNNKTPVAFEEGEDNGIVSTEDGIFIPKTTCLFLDLNEEADLRNYTLVYDIKLADVLSFTSLLQTDLENDNNDSELFIAKGQLGINRGVPYLGYNGVFNADTWHKVVVVGDNGSISTYLDGLFIGAAGPDRTWPEAWVINKEGVYFFLDNDGESTDVEVAGIQLWKKCLSDVEIAQLSGVREIVGEPIPARTAMWSFDDADNLYASEVGNITLSPRKVGANKTVPTEFAEGEANGVEKIEEGISLEKTTCLFMDLSEAADLTDYTFVYDLKVADSNPYISIFQTDLNNSTDGDLFINGGKLGINSSGLGYGGQVVSNQWHRLAFVVKAGVISTYIDGVHLKTAASANAAWTINKEGVYLFLDESGERTAVSVGGVQFWNQALTDAHIAAMGAAFAEDADVKVEVPAAAAPTYTVSGPLCHPSNVNQHYLSNGYGDGLAEAHSFTLVGKNTYAIQNSKGKYYAYKAGTTVVQMVDDVDESCYWQFVTEEEFLSKFAEATAVNPVNATFAIEGQGFGYNNTGVKMWTGEPNTGGDYTDYVAYKQNVENFDFSYVVRNMPSGVYRLKVQGFYRQGTPEAAVEARKNGTEINPAKFYANDASVTVMSIIEEAGKNTASTHGGMYGDYGKCPLSNNDASIYFNVGLYEHEIVFSLEEGIDTIKIGMAKNGGVADDWAVMDNFRLEYLGAKNDADFMGAGVVDAMTEGDKYVYYTSADGKKHYLYAAGEHNWVVVDEPTTIAFSTGKGTYAKSASHMTSNGFQMANTVNVDGTGAIATSTNTRDWDSQVFYKNNAGKYAIRLTNVNTAKWGANCFVDIDPATLEIEPGKPSLGDELYLWEVEDAIILNTITYEVDGEVYHTDSLPYGASITAPVSPSKDGYTFRGWIELPKTMPGNDITVIGVFIANNYQITYMLGDEVYYTDSVACGAQIPTVTPSKEGYTFNGWEGLPETMPANDLVINASFTVNSYTITYMLDGRVYKTVTYNYGETIVPEESPKTTGYVFSGWLGLPETMPAEDLIIVGVFAALDGNYTDDQGVQYTLEDNKEGYAVSGISKNPASNIVIPAEVNDLPVTAIYERAFIAVENVQSVVIPSNITTVGKNVFYGCKNLLFIEWNTTAPLRADCFDKAENYGNMLIFVNNADVEVSYKGNVIVEGVAEQITISNDMAFRSPQQFTARNITFTKNFDKKTKIGTSGGWEAMMLPFDVQRVVSEMRGELKPFGEADFDTSLPYWLGELQADGTFVATQRIVANKPFIMQLPNSDEYEDRYNVEGKVTFSAEEVTVLATTDVEQEEGEGYVLLGSYEGIESDNYIYALNDEEYAVGGDTYMPGGVFVAGSRAIRPFEAYIYSASANRAPYLRIGGCDTGVEDLVADKEEVWHTLQGIRLSGRPTERGIYIRNGKKVMVK